MYKMCIYYTRKENFPANIPRLNVFTSSDTAINLVISLLQHIYPIGYIMETFGQLLSLYFQFQKSNMLYIRTYKGIIFDLEINSERLSTVSIRTRNLRSIS